nr:TPA_asm: RNA-dependent RNA polymerase [Moniex tapwovirus]
MMIGLTGESNPQTHNYQHIITKFVIVTIAMVVPAEVGGMISTTYESFCMRGGADPLTRSLYITRWLWENAPELQPYMAPYIRLRTSYTPDPLLLLQDPTCLPLDRPRVLSTLFSLSNAALASRFIGRFTSPMSVVQAASQIITTMPALWNKITLHDEQFKRFYSLPPVDNVPLNSLLIYPDPCTCKIADRLREHHWGPLEGVTMPYPGEQVDYIPMHP